MSVLSIFWSIASHLSSSSVYYSSAEVQKAFHSLWIYCVFDSQCYVCNIPEHLSTDLHIYCGLNCMWFLWRRIERRERKTRGLILCEAHFLSSVVGVCPWLVLCVFQLAPDDAWRCPHCKQLQQGRIKLSLWTLPDVLILHLKRFRQVF